MSQINHSLILQSLPTPTHPLLLGVASLILSFYADTAVLAEESCSAAYTINAALPNGATWNLCWEQTLQNGISLHHIAYQPKGQPALVDRHPLAYSESARRW